MREWKNFNQYRKIIPILLTLLVFFGCEEPSPNNAPEITEMIVYPSQPKAGQIVLLTGIASDEDNDALSYKWMASGGTFLDSLGSNPIQWQAPIEPDSINLYFQASDQEVSTIMSYNFYLETGVGIVAGHVTDMSTGFHLNNVVVNISGIETTTGSDGYFKFTDVEAGSNIPISASATNYVTYASLMDVKVEENIVDISMTLLTEVGRVAGYVSDAGTGLKLAGVIVQTGTISDTTEADGYYELYNVPNSQNVPVRASLDGYSIHSSLINVIAGYNTNDIILEPNIATVSGRVTAESDDTLLEGVVVTINQYEGVTNAAGFYEIVDIPVTSSASVSASLEGYITSYSILDIIGGMNNLDIELSDNPGSLSGWVRSSLDGSVLGNVAVQVGQNFFTTSVTGAYEAPGLQTGPMLVTCSVEGYDAFTELLEIVEGANALDINLDPNIGTVTGFVRDSVAAISLVGKQVQLGNKTTYTETDGSFEFEDVALGQHLLSVDLETYESYSYILEVEAGNTVHNVLMIPTTGNVLGIVRDVSTNEIIVGATVSIDDDHSTETDENGYFEILSITKGSVRISCEAEYYVSSEEAIEIGFGDNIHDITLLPGIGRVVGTVIDAADNAPLSGVLIAVGALADTTDVNGLFSFSNLELGTAQLLASVAGYVSQTQLVEVQIGENVTNFSLVADHGSLQGYILDETDSMPLDQATVILGSDTVITGPDGYYEFLDKPVAESLVFNISRTDYTSYSDWIVLEVGENTVNIQMVSNIGSLMGYITDSVSGAALDSAQVILGSDTVRTDNTGYYEVSGVAVEENLVFKVSQDNYSEYSDWAILEVGENVMDVTLVADPAVLMGYVRDSVTEALLDSVVLIYDSDTLMTGLNGYYEFDARMPATQDTLWAQLSGYVSNLQWVILNPGDNTVDIDLIQAD